MFFRRERQQAAALSSLMSQTQDVVVCFGFKTPIDLDADNAVIDRQLRQTRIVEASKTFARYFGYKNREDIIGKDMMELVDQTVPEWFFSFGSEVKANEYKSIERVVKIPLGDQTLHMRAHMENIFEEGLLVRQWVTLRDVTAEEKTRIELETTQQMQSLSLEAIGLESFELTFPITKHTLFPKWWDQIHELDKDHALKDFVAFSDQPSNRLRTSFRLIDFDGAVSWKECWMIQRQSATGDEVDSAIGVLLDRSDEKALEDRILSMQRLEGLGVLAGGIAHDFNNLLVSIVGSLDLAKHHHPELADSIAPSNHAAEQLAALCQQLLTYAGQGTVEHDKLDLVALIEDFTDVLKLSVHRNAAIEFDLEDACWIRGDQNQIRQIILNLVKNASDALSEKNGTITLSTCMAEFSQDWAQSFHLGTNLKEGAYVSLQVKDNGSGIPGEVVSRIFDPFFSTKSTGRGLGLAVVIGAVKSHDGAVRVQSSEQGTAFTIALPATKTPNETLIPSEAKSVNTNSDEVLIVDDAEDVLTIASAMFKSLGKKVTTALSADDGIEKFKQTPTLPIFMDVTMPGKNGIEAAQEILVEYPNANIILCSGYTNLDLPEELNGKVQFLRKPYRLIELKGLNLS
jgi:signal transduction histidine kinase/CheY-like chemotaxis protein